MIRFSNQEDQVAYLLRWTEDISIDRALIPLLRRVMPSIIANDIIGVSPMTGPVGQIFAMRSRYANAPDDQDDQDDDDADTYTTSTDETSEPSPPLSRIHPSVKDSDYAVDSDDDLLQSVLDEPTFPMDIDAILSAMSKTENNTIANMTRKKIAAQRHEILSSLNLTPIKLEEFDKSLRTYRVIENPYELKHHQQIRWIPLRSLETNPYLTKGGALVKMVEDLEVTNKDLAKLIDLVVQSKEFRDKLVDEQYSYIKKLSDPIEVVKEWEKIFETIYLRNETIKRKSKLILFENLLAVLSERLFYLRKMRMKNIKSWGKEEYEKLTK